MATYTDTSPTVGDTRGNPEAWIAYLADAGAARMAEVERYVREVYRIAPGAGLPAHKIVTQAVLETTAQDSAGRWVPFSSTWWVKRLNPAGIGITGDPQQNERSKTFADGVDAARGHVYHYALYTRDPIPRSLEGYRANDPRADAVPIAALGKRLALRDFGSADWRTFPTWANDPSYGSKWAARLNELAPVFSEGETVMAYTAHRFVGLNADVWLPDDIEVIIDIVPASRKNIRSNQKFTGQTKTTWHDTGNPNSDAWMERNWLHGGAGGAYVGYNFAYDAKRIIQLTPLDEVTWAAGTPEGNKFSWHAEQCLKTDWDGALRVGAALHGGLCAAKGWQVDTALVQHRVWYGKWCPAQILNRNLWSHVVAMTSNAALAALGAAAGGDVPTTPIYAAPVPIPQLEAYRNKPDNAIPYRVVLPDGTVCIYVADRVGAFRDTRRRRFSDGPEDVGPPIRKGDEFDVDWLLIHPDRPDMYLTPWQTRVLVEDTGRISDVKASAATNEDAA